MPTTPIPLFNTVEEIYTATSYLTQAKRWDTFFSAFEKEYEGTPVQFVSRAPGRVNIIGEHIDYCGFSVLPAAVERDCLIAFSTAPSPTLTSSLPRPANPKRTVVLLRNTDPKYTPTSFNVNLSGDGSDLPMPKEHHWSSYFIAGTKGILAHMHESQAITTPSPPYLLILMTGSVPTGSGLSSSSAMTTASAVTIMQVAGRREGGGMIDRRSVTNVAIESERLVGVNSGGMDQSASVFSLPQHLLHIEFNPKLEAHPIPLPEINPGFSFVIANTLVTSDKKVTAKFCYNLRVVETLLGARLLAKHLNIPASPSGKPQTYKQVLDFYFSHPPPTHSSHIDPSNAPTHLPSGLPTVPALPSSHLVSKLARNQHELKTMLAIAGKVLGGPGMESGLTWTEVASRLGEDEEELRKVIQGETEVEPVGGKLKIWTRARHVFTEALRVYQFVDLLSSSSQPSPSPSDLSPPKSSLLLTQLGSLMNESQRSCRLDYECSCPEIDDVVSIALANGALGSRLTGAGWGGATVSLVPEDKVQGFIKAVREEYYKKNFPNLSEEELDDVCFATKPEMGAGVYQA